MIDFAREKICFYNSMYQGRSSAFEIADFAARHGAFAVEIRHLSDCMDTGIGAAGAANLNFLPQNTGKCGFQLTLDGIVVAT